jgi:hypothetical protein
MQVHPQQLSPSEAFDVFYFIRNHTDATTYYVRAVIYDVRTGAILTSVNLEQSATNARLFLKTLEAPPDPVGIGRNIVAIASVYTDSSYSTKSQDYEEQEQYFLIKAVPPLMIGGGGVDMRAMREMMEEVVDDRLGKLPPPEKQRDFPAMPFDSVFGAIGAVMREVGRIPKEAHDDAPLRAAIDETKAAIAALPPPEKTDLKPVFTALDALTKEIAALRRDERNAASALMSTHKQLMSDAIDQFKTNFEQALKELMGKQKLTLSLSDLLGERQPSPESPEKNAKPDLSSIAHILG